MSIAEYIRTKPYRHEKTLYVRVYVGRGIAIYGANNNNR